MKQNPPELTCLLKYAHAMPHTRQKMSLIAVWNTMAVLKESNLYCKYYCNAINVKDGVYDENLTAASINRFLVFHVKVNYFLTYSILKKS